MIRAVDLPIDAVLDELAAALAAPGSAAVVVAPPGAGKSTIVPLLLESQPWCRGRVVVVEPRRVATRAVAARMADLRHEQVGEGVGWRMRDDTKVSSRTRVEVVTEGVLTRLLHADPALSGIDAVVFDEFHERSLDADLGLAFTLDARAVLRPELRIVVMSATLDGAAVAALLDDARIVQCAHRRHPIATTYLGADAPAFDPGHVARATARALEEVQGNVLVFVPGIHEINQVQRSIQREPRIADRVEVLSLHGSLRPAEQDRVLGVATTRRVIVATSIAETSLTVDGVDAVVDSGFSRVPRFDARRGMGGLATVRVSRSSADQRRGRAGRTGPGRCYRLWSELEHERLRDASDPEIVHADLAPLALDLVRWADPDGTTLRFLDPPPPDALRAARALLQALGIVDDDLHLTDHGRRCAELPLHPRLAHSVVRASELGHGALACTIAAFLSDRRRNDARSVDLGDQIETDRRGSDVARRARVIARRARALGCELETSLDTGAAGVVLALAYPDRVARRRSAADARYLLTNGVGGVLPAHDPLAASEWIAVADLEAREQDARIFTAAALTRSDVDRLFGSTMTTVDDARWDQQLHDVRATRDRRLGAIVVTRQPLHDPVAIQSAVLDGIEREGLGLLPRFAEAEPLRARVAFCRAVIDDEPWPDLSDGALLAALDTWLVPYLGAVRRRADLGQVDVVQALRALVPGALLARLDTVAPASLVVPTGSRIAIDYADGRPVARVRLQEVLGWADTPRVAGGRVPIVLHLLSPAGRPIQVTSDLAAFWQGAYASVRAEMRGRYPKHDWPADPAQASPSRGVKRPRRAP